MSSLRRAGHQSNEPGAVEARDTISADVCAADFADWLPVEQHGNRRLSRFPRFHDQVHLAGSEGKDDLAGALSEFNILASAAPITFEGGCAQFPAFGADIRLVGDPRVGGLAGPRKRRRLGRCRRQLEAGLRRNQQAADFFLDFVVAPFSDEALYQSSLTV